jgi:hypothetical protein
LNFEHAEALKLLKRKFVAHLGPTRLKRLSYKGYLAYAEEKKNFKLFHEIILYRYIAHRQGHRSKQT